MTNKKIHRILKKIKLLCWNEEMMKNYSYINRMRFYDEIKQVLLKE